jgi:hypothetical protein
MRKLNYTFILVVLTIFVSCTGKVEVSNPTDPETDIFGDPISATASESKGAVEKCFNCGDDYPEGEGYFRHREAGTIFMYRQRQDVLKVAVDRYCCSERCAMPYNF